jgi:hypothetical protein
LLLPLSNEQTAAKLQEFQQQVSSYLQIAAAVCDNVDAAS